MSAATPGRAGRHELQGSQREGTGVAAVRADEPAGLLPGPWLAQRRSVLAYEASPGPRILALSVLDAQQWLWQDGLAPCRTALHYWMDIPPPASAEHVVASQVPRVALLVSIGLLGLWFLRALLIRLRHAAGQGGAWAPSTGTSVTGFVTTFALPWEMCPSS
jgi:hypothetical protein